MGEYMKVRAVFLSMLIVVLAGGCGSAPASTPTMPPIPLRGTSGRVETATPTRTYTPVLTATDILVPTLSQELANAKIEELLRTNGNCEFPCWWGMEPGLSSWDDAKRLLEPLAMEIAAFPTIQSKIKYEAVLPDPEKKSFQNKINALIYVGETGLIDLMNVPISEKTIQDIYDQYGIPDEVWVSFAGGTQGDNTYLISSLYQNEGILVTVGGIGEEKLKGGKQISNMNLLNDREFL